MKNKLLTFIVLHLGVAAALAQPVITNQPQDQTVLAGTNVTFSVGATGTPPLSYQWRSYANATAFTNIPGATETQLLMTNVQPTSRRFGVVVTDGASLSVTSTLARLTVLPPPTITGQPADGVRDVGGSATFSVVASSTAPLSYQWWWNTNLLAGQTNRTLVLTNLQLTHLGQYSVVVSNFTGSTTSRMAGLGLYITVAPRFDPVLSISQGAGGMGVRWQGNGQLERALGVRGPWQLLSAASPFTNSPAGARAFFRVKHPRPVRVYVPSRYDARSPAPLMIALHGYTLSGAEIENYLRLQPLAESRGFVYCYPDGITNSLGNRFWNATDACCDFHGVGVDDAVYLRGLIEEIGTTLAIERKRVYLLGHSNGGSMSYWMACRFSDVIAGIASLAGATTLGATNCRPSHPVNVLQIHGTADSIAPYAGGRLSTSVPGVTTNTPPVTGAMQVVQLWAGFNDSQEPVTDAGPSLDLDLSVGGLDTIVTRYTNSPPGGAVELWTINGGSHIPTLTSQFSPRVIDWLLAHPKP